MKSSKSAAGKRREFLSSSLLFHLSTQLLTSFTSEMVSLIPRISSLAVSGTPAKSSVKDLISVLKYILFTASEYRNLTLSQISPD